MTAILRSSSQESASKNSASGKVQESQSRRGSSSIPVAPHSTKRKSFKAEPSARKKRQSKPPNKRTSSLSDNTLSAATPGITASHYGRLSVLHDPPERSVNTVLIAPKIVRVSGKCVPCMRWRSHVMLNISNIRRESRGTSVSIVYKCLSSR